MAEATIMLGYIEMITYGAKTIYGKLILKRWFKRRHSDKRKRFNFEMRRFRKMWWHFKTRWEA